jgi:hypothetical protein
MELDTIECYFNEERLTPRRLLVDERCAGGRKSLTRIADFVESDVQEGKKYLFFFDKKLGHDTTYRPNSVK